MPAQVDAIVWLRREFLWLDNRWPALATEVRKRPHMTAHEAQIAALAKALHHIGEGGSVCLAPDEVAARVGLSLPVTANDGDGGDHA